MARQEPLETAVAEAKKFVIQAIRQAFAIAHAALADIATLAAHPLTVAAVQKRT